MRVVDIDADVVSSQTDPLACIAGKDLKNYTITYESENNELITFNASDPSKMNEFKKSNMVALEVASLDRSEVYVLKCYC